MIVLLLLFLGAYASTTFFTHGHKVGDQWVFHSHPYGASSSDACGGGHHHSSDSFRTINYFAASFIFLESQQHFSLFQDNVSVTLIDRSNLTPRFSFYTHASLRAPPTV
ncbi:MAG: hypothetical protein ACK5JU_10080 [Bacteroidales bacterium]